MNIIYISLDRTDNNMVNSMRFCRSRLSSAQHTLAQLKRNLQQSPDRAAILHLDVSRGQIEGDEEDVDRMNRNLAEKLQEIQGTEERIMALKRKIQELEAGHGGADDEVGRRTAQSATASRRSDTPGGLSARRDGTGAPAEVKSPGDYHVNRLRSSAATPQVGLGDSFVRNNTPDIREVASRQVTELTNRIEKITTRLLKTESEKKDAEEQLASQRAVVQGALQLQHDLRDCEDRLGQALEAAQSANMQLLQREAEVERCSAKLKEKDRLIKAKDDRLTSLEAELAEMTKELDFFRNHQEKKPTLGEGISREGERKAHVDKLEAFSLKMTVDDLEAKIVRLNEELEESMKHAAKLSEQVMSSQKETEKWREKARQLEKEHKLRVHDLEDENVKYRTLLHDIKSDLERVGRERDKYELSLRKAESDLQALMRAKQKYPSTTRSSSVSSRKKKGPHYLDLSTDSELEQSDKSDDQIIYAPKSTLRDDNISQLERKAVEIMAQTLLEELKQSKITNGHFAASKADSLKEACIRATLRIFSSKEDSGEEKGEGSADRGSGRVGPFEILGDRRFLSQLVAEIYDNMSTLEDSEQIKAEVKQLEVCLEELANL